MNSEWFYRINGSTNGPLNTEELKQEIANGNIRPTDFLWKAGYTGWKRAGDVGHLFPEPPEEPFAPELEVPAILGQLWRGEIGLAITFWVLGVGIGAVSFFVFGFLATIVPLLLGGAETTAGAWAGWAFGTILWSIAMYISVSVWRSAGKSATTKL
ncbi:MAG: DUF4339 domain-containing protein [Alteromonadaceae bacterium]|nr:DUF4339 domain-containing protein [Alteromonadaceae bacterium]